MPEPTTTRRQRSADLPIEVLPADAQRFDDVTAVLNPAGSDRACWCLAYRVKSTDYNAMDADQRSERLRGFCAERPAPGVLAYAEGTPVGWCGVSPRSRLERLKRSRTIPTLDDVPVWSVICFVVRPEFRRRGVTGALLDGAVEYARSCGAPAIEGYPVDPEGARISSTAAHVGTTALFEAAGFRRVQETQARVDKRPRWLMRLDLA